MLTRFHVHIYTPVPSGLQSWKAEMVRSQLLACQMHALTTHSTRPCCSLECWNVLCYSVWFPVLFQELQTFLTILSSYETYERDVKCTGQDKGENLHSIVLSNKEYITIKMKDTMLELRLMCHLCGS